MFDSVWQPADLLYFALLILGLAAAGLVAMRLNEKDQMSNIFPVSKRAFYEIQGKMIRSGHAADCEAGDKGKLPAINFGNYQIVPSEDSLGNNSETVLWVTSIFGAETKKGLVEIEIQGQSMTITPTEARAFAYNLLEGAESAESDELIMAWLEQTIKVDSVEARARILLDLRKIRDKKREK